MLADYFTKPLQEKLFRRFREVIMGYKHIKDILLYSTFPLKEHVEIRDGIIIENVRADENHNIKVTYANIVQRNGTMTETPVKPTLKFVVRTKIEAVGTPGTVSLGDKVVKNETLNLLTILK